MISGALAQNATQAAAQAGSAAAELGEPFYAAPEFWVALALFILIAAVAKPVWPLITGMLDQRIDAIRDRLDEAARLREEAQELLASYKRKLAEAGIAREGGSV